MASTVVPSFAGWLRAGWDIHACKEFGTVSDRDKCPEIVAVMILRWYIFQITFLLQISQEVSFKATRWFIKKEVTESRARPGCSCNLDTSFVPLAFKLYPPHPNVLSPWLPREQKEHSTQCQSSWEPQAPWDQVLHAVCKGLPSWEALAGEAPPWELPVGGERHSGQQPLHSPPASCFPILPPLSSQNGSPHCFIQRPTLVHHKALSLFILKEEG